MPAPPGQPRSTGRLCPLRVERGVPTATLSLRSGHDPVRPGPRGVRASVAARAGAPSGHPRSGRTARPAVRRAAGLRRHVPAEESVPPGSQRSRGDEPRRGARAHHHHRRMTARHMDGTDLTSVADVRHGWTPMTRLPQGVRVLRRLRPQSDSADRRAARARRIANPFRTASHEPHRRCRRLRRAHVRRTPLP